MLSKVKEEFDNILNENFLQSLWNWRIVVMRYRLKEIRIPSGTTNVEGGFHALRQCMKIVHSQYSLKRFQSLCRIAIMVLNFYILHKREIPFAFSQDAQSFHIVQAVMYEIISSKADGLTTSMHNAFIQFVKLSSENAVP